MPIDPKALLAHILALPLWAVVVWTYSLTPLWAEWSVMVLTLPVYLGITYGVLRGLEWWAER